MKAITHKRELGTLSDGRHVRVEATYSVENGKDHLSITGETYLLRRVDSETCGQIDDDVLTLAHEQHSADIVRLVKIWRRWHLNDMQAGCEHQRADAWNKRPIDPDRPLTDYGYFGGRSTTWNMLIWVTKEEHPDGLLSEPCPTCGYKYGSAWLHEPVPTSVVRKLGTILRTPGVAA